MSVLDRTLSAIKDILLLREQLKDLRGDVTSLSGDVAGLVGDIRAIEQRVARLEGAEDTIRALFSERQPRLPDR